MSTPAPATLPPHPSVSLPDLTHLLPLIYAHLARGDLARCLCVSRTSFLAAAPELYRSVDLVRDLAGRVLAPCPCPNPRRIDVDVDVDQKGPGRELTTTTTATTAYHPTPTPTPTRTQTLRCIKHLRLPGIMRYSAEFWAEAFERMRALRSVSVVAGWEALFAPNICKSGGRSIDVGVGIGMDTIKPIFDSLSLSLSLSASASASAPVPFVRSPRAVDVDDDDDDNDDDQGVVDNRDTEINTRPRALQAGVADADADAYGKEDHSDLADVDADADANANAIAIANANAVTARPPSLTLIISGLRSPVGPALCTMGIMRVVRRLRLVLANAVPVFDAPASASASALGSASVSRPGGIGADPPGFACATSMLAREALPGHLERVEVVLPRRMGGVYVGVGVGGGEGGGDFVDGDEDVGVGGDWEGEDWDAAQAWECAVQEEDERGGEHGPLSARMRMRMGGEGEDEDGTTSYRDRDRDRDDTADTVREDRNLVSRGSHQSSPSIDTVPVDMNMDVDPPTVANPTEHEHEHEHERSVIDSLPLVLTTSQLHRQDRGISSPIHPAIRGPRALARARATTTSIPMPMPIYKAPASSSSSSSNHRLNTPLEPDLSSDTSLPRPGPQLRPRRRPALVPRWRGHVLGPDIIELARAVPKGCTIYVVDPMRRPRGTGRGSGGRRAKQPETEGNDQGQRHVRSRWSGLRQRVDGELLRAGNEDLARVRWVL